MYVCVYNLLIYFVYTMLGTLQRIFLGGGDKSTKKKTADNNNKQQTAVNKVRSNNEDFSFIPITDSTGLSSAAQKNGDSSYMNNMNDIINSQRIYGASHRSKPEVQESDEIRLSTNSTRGNDNNTKFDNSNPKKKRKARSRSQQGGGGGKRSKSTKRKSLTSSTKKTPRRQNPGGGGRSTSRKKPSNKSVGKRSRAKSTNKRSRKK